MSSTPVISICIPTFNRCGYLYFTLKSIVEQEIFKNTNDIEIVVSDNNSSDLTERISKIFVEKYPNKIIYNKNEDNIGDRNFEKVLTLGHGEVLKLHNDNFILKDGALELIVNKIKELQDERPMIFFANGNSRAKTRTLCNNLNEFVETASYLTTWIAAFSIWKDDLGKVKCFTRNIHTFLTQTDVLFQMSANGKKMFVWDEEIFEGQGVLKKGGYNIPKIFGKNYLSLLKPYLKSGQLDNKVYEKEKRVLLLNHIIPMKFSSSRRENGWQFKNDGYWRHLFSDYWHYLYFYTSVVKIFRLMLDAELNLIGRKLNKNSYQKYWRKRNRHNETTIGKDVDETKILVGKKAKGHIEAVFSNNPNELLIVDDNATIQENVVFTFDKDELIIIKNSPKTADNSIVIPNSK